jgi:hypothetical protein
MRRRWRICVWAAALALALTIGRAAAAGAEAAGAGAQGSDAVRLANSSLAVEIDNRTGAIRRLDDRSGGVSLAAPQAEGFRLILRDRAGALLTLYAPTANSPNKPAWTMGAERASAEWTIHVSNGTGNVGDVQVRVVYALAGPELRVSMSVANRTRATLLEVWYPGVGGLKPLAGPGGAGQIVGSNPAVRRSISEPAAESVSAHYPGMLPMPFFDIGGSGGAPGLYFGAHETLARLKVLRLDGRGPDVCARIIHVPFLKPGRQMAGATAVYRFHRGGFAGAGEIYRRWFLRTFGIASPDGDWLRQQSFFQMTMFMLPEGNIRYRFRDIPRWAADARKYGVMSVQVAGWQRGGHDNGYPYYEPDPRMGTWSDLRRAIRAVHRMGMKIYFFANVQPAMLDLDWYHRELCRYVEATETGDPFWIAGWGMGTLASRMGLTTPQMAFLDPAFQPFSDALMRFYRRLAAAGADGVHLDKMFPTGIDCNPRLSMPADTAPWEGAIRFLERLTRECRAIHPDFRISAECNWDRVLQFGTATWWAGNMTAVKTVFPETAETVGLYQPYDYAGVNNAVRNGWVVMVAPFSFQRSMDTPEWRSLAAYIRDVKRVRDRLSGTVFLGESLGAGQARFDPPLRDASVADNVFRNMKTKRLACVVTNNGDASRTVRFEGFEGSRARRVRIHIPGRGPIEQSLPADVEIRAERLVMIEEIAPGAEASAVRPASPKPARHRSAQPDGEGGAPFPNADFERGSLEGWTADPNWAVDDNSAGGWYSGWQGHWFAWSGKGGEARTGKLRSPVFTLSRTGVQLLISGWADMWGRTPDRWNYVTLNLESGRELDRIYAPNTTMFTPVVLDGTGHLGERVYLEAVDDAAADTFSMLCIDDVRLVDAPRPVAVPPVRSAAGAHVIENGLYRVEIDGRNGAVVRIRDKAAGEELIGEPRLADNFRLSLPILGHEAWQNSEGNYIQGRDQRLTACRAVPGGLELLWRGPLRAESGRRYNVSVRMRICLRGDAVRFDLHVENHTKFEIGEVSYPMLGGLTGIGRSLAERKSSVLVLPAGAGVQRADIFRTFNSMSWLGVFGPEQFYAYPTTLSMPWVALRSARTGRMAYFGAHDPVARFKVAQLEMAPGVSGARAGGNWPRSDELHGRPAGVKLCWTHIAYNPAGRPFDASPVVLRCSKGDWQDAARFYAAWLQGLSREGGSTAGAAIPAWKACERIRFDALAERARTAAASGVHALLLTDWKTGAGDDGVPSFAPAPELGGEPGLHDAIAACRAEGVAVYLQARINPVSKRSDLYRSELQPFTCIDRWGVATSALGWGRPRTLAEGFAAGERRVWLNPGQPAYRAILVRQISRLASAGVAGVELLGFFGQPLDFNRALAAGPDRASWEEALRTLREATLAGRAIRPDFTLVLDQPWDRLVAGPTAVRVDCPADSPLREAFPAWRP